VAVETRDQQRIQAVRAVLGQHTEDQQPKLIHDPSPREQAGDAERKEAPAGALQHLVDIGHGDGACDRLAVDFRAESASRVKDRPQFSGNSAELV
jgi:hypothetical protein